MSALGNTTFAFSYYQY